MWRMQWPACHTGGRRFAGRRRMNDIQRRQSYTLEDGECTHAPTDENHETCYTLERGECSEDQRAATASCSDLLSVCRSRASPGLEASMSQPASSFDNQFSAPRRMEFSPAPRRGAEDSARPSSRFQSRARDATSRTAMTACASAVVVATGLRRPGAARREGAMPPPLSTPATRRHKQNGFPKLNTARTNGQRCIRCAVVLWCGHPLRTRMQPLVSPPTADRRWLRSAQPCYIWSSACCPLTPEHPGSTPSRNGMRVGSLGWPRRCDGARRCRRD